MADFVLKTKWFGADAPVNAKKAKAEIGSGTNGKVAVVYDKYGTEGNAYSIEVVAGTGESKKLTSALSGTKVTVTLGTDAEGVLDDAKNTAKLIETSISGIAGFVATASGTGETAFADAVAEISLAGGQFATPCRERGSMVKDATYHYVCTQEGNTTDTVWKRFSLTDY